jgi:hypothetical protein
MTERDVTERSGDFRDRRSAAMPFNSERAGAMVVLRSSLPSSPSTQLTQRRRPCQIHLSCKCQARSAKWPPNYRAIYVLASSEETDRLSSWLGVRQDGTRRDRIWRGGGNRRVAERVRPTGRRRWRGKQWHYQSTDGNEAVSRARTTATLKDGTSSWRLLNDVPRRSPLIFDRRPSSRGT